MTCPSCGNQMEVKDVRKIVGVHNTYNKVKFYCDLCDILQWGYPRDRPPWKDEDKEANEAVRKYFESLNKLDDENQY